MSELDLLDLDGKGLYFEEPLPSAVNDLLHEAAEHYGTERCEQALWRGWLQAPGHLVVLVALYRFFFFSHRLRESLQVARWAMAASAERLGLPCDWAAVNESHLPGAAAQSFGLLRFYLRTLKAVAVLSVRLGRSEQATEISGKIKALDPLDRLGAGALLTLARRAITDPRGGDDPGADCPADLLMSRAD